jgi:hypothetical protein
MTALALATLAAVCGQGTKNPLPGPAKWELRAFERLFRVQRTTYDAGTKRVRWSLATLEGARTADLKRDLDQQPFTFVFLDEQGKEVGYIRLNASDYRGFPSGRIAKPGTTLDVSITLPKTFDKAKTVTLKRTRVNE